MLTIENVHKIVGRKIPIQSNDWIARIKDVYYTIDNTYVFEVETNSTADNLNQKRINIVLNRKPPVGVYSKERQWELSWETYTHSKFYEIELVSSRVVEDMNLFGLVLGNFTDRIMYSK